MKRSERNRLINCIEADGPELLRGFAGGSDPLMLTQNGVTETVPQDIDSYEQTQETLALLAILALGKREVEVGQTKEASAVFAHL